MGGQQLVLRGPVPPMPPAASGRWTVEEEEAHARSTVRARDRPEVRATKVRDGHRPLVMVTAYDAPGARIVDAAGVDLILVGDSVANVVLGYEDTLQVTVDDMAHHVAAVARARPGALIVGDLPWMSYHVDVADTVRNGATLIRAGAQCVKLEGGAVRAPMVEALVRRRDPGHGPHRPHPPVGQRLRGLPGPGPGRRGGRRRSSRGPGPWSRPGRSPSWSRGSPRRSGTPLTEALDVPTIGIGAGAGCDGQVLVLHDLLGVTERTAKFVRRYADPGRRRHRGGRRLRRRRPVGGLPGRRGGLPLTVG